MVEVVHQQLVQQLVMMGWLPMRREALDSPVLHQQVRLMLHSQQQTSERRELI